MAPYPENALDGKVQKFVLGSSLGLFATACFLRLTLDILMTAVFEGYRVNLPGELGFAQ